MKILQLSVNDGIEHYNMLQTIGPNENKFNNAVNGMSFEEFKQWLKMQDDWSKGLNLPEGYVKQWIFWLCLDDSTPIGFGKIREKLNDNTREFGGNLGFAISSDYRGHGYGNTFFNMLLDKAREFKLEEIISTVEKYNYPSKKVHEYCGGELYKETDIRWYYRYK